MKFFISFTILFLLSTGACFSQNLLTPGDKSLDVKKLKSSTYEMELYAQSKSGYVPVGSYTVTVKPAVKTIAVYTVLKMYSNNEKYIDTTVADAATLAPIYRSSTNPAKDMVLKYGKVITGHYLDKAKGKRTEVKETAGGVIFDSYIYPYVFAAMPITLGYRAKMPVFECKPGNNSNFKSTFIESVNNNVYKSQFSGEHKVWQVHVYEEGTNDKYDYFIDKDNSRIWKIEVSAGDGQKYLLTDKEIDFEIVIKTAFSKSETLKLIKDGNSVISGVAYAKDNGNNLILKGKSVFNINKKQFAPKGTSIILIPYTTYYKDWMRVNEELRKNGRPVPLSKEAAECIKVTTVYDDKGNFDFTNLMPGEYLLVTEFAYTHTNTRTEVIGYTDTYINGAFAGSQERTKTTQYGTEAGASIRKFVTIKTNGEKVTVTLKQTGSLL